MARCLRIVTEGTPPEGIPYACDAWDDNDLDELGARVVNSGVAYAYNIDHCCYVEEWGEQGVVCPLLGENTDLGPEATNRMQMVIGAGLATHEGRANQAAGLQAELMEQSMARIDTRLLLRRGESYAHHR